MINILSWIYLCNTNAWSIIYILSINFVKYFLFNDYPI